MGILWAHTGAIGCIELISLVPRLSVYEARIIGCVNSEHHKVIRNGKTYGLVQIAFHSARI